MTDLGSTASDFGRYEPTRWDFLCALLTRRELWAAVACYALLLGLGIFIWNWTP